MKLSVRNLTIVGIVILAGLSRVIPHVPGFVPVTAATILAGSVISRKGLAVVATLFSVWISDLILNNTIYSEYYEGFTWFTPGFVYMFSAYAIISLASTTLSTSDSPVKIAGFSVGGSLVFWLLSNFSVWAAGSYGTEFGGFVMCYEAAIPFLERSLLADAVFTFALFYGFQFASSRVKALEA